MLKITRGTSSTIVVTLKEKQTLANPTFLFRFISEGRNVEKAFIAADIATSSQKERFNKFSIVESAVENLTNGVVSLTEGIYEYQVFEQTSTTNLDYRLADNLNPVEIGLAKVTGTPTDTFKRRDYSDTFTWRTT